MESRMRETNMQKQTTPLDLKEDNQTKKAFLSGE